MLQMLGCPSKITKQNIFLGVRKANLSLQQYVNNIGPYDYHLKVHETSNKQNYFEKVPICF